MKQPSRLARIVVEERHRHALQLGVVAQLPEEQLAAVAGAVDDDALAVALMRKRNKLAKEREAEAARGQREQEKHCVDDEDRRPQTAEAADEAGANDRGDGAEGHAARVAHDVDEAGVVP